MNHLAKVLSHRTRLVVFAALFACALVACDGGDGSNSAGNSDDTIEIGFAMTLDHPYWQNMRLGAEDEAKKAGAGITITNAQEDAVKQIQQVRQLIAEQVDIICLVPMKKEPLVEAVAMCNRANIPVIIVNRELGDGAEYICYVGTDSYQGTLVAAKILFDAIDGAGSIVEFHQETGTGPEVDATRALRDLLKEYPNVQIVDRLPQKSSRELVVSEMQTVLDKHPNIKGVYCQDDVFAIAAAEVCRRSGRDDIKITGFGGGKESFAAIKEGLITGSSFQRPEEEGREAIKLALRHLAGEELEKRYPIACPPLTLDTVDQYKPQW